MSRTAKELWGVARRAVLRGDSRWFEDVCLEDSAAQFAGAGQIIVAVNSSPYHRVHARSLKSWKNVLWDEWASLLEAAAVVSSKTVAPFWTMFILIVMCTLFSFIAAESSRLCFSVDQPARPVGPRNLCDFLRPGGGVTLINPQYLYAWGAFYLPEASLPRGVSRWITNSFLHLSLRHCMSNMSTYCIVSAPFEMHVGTINVMLIWFASALGGTFCQSVFGDPCTVLVGASGSVYGVMGALVADTALFWHMSKRPYLRCLMILSLFGFMLGQTPNSAEVVSTLAHSGGCIVGAATSVLLFARRDHARAPFLLKAVCWLVLIVIPILGAVSFAKGRTNVCGTIWSIPTPPKCSV